MKRLSPYIIDMNPNGNFKVLFKENDLTNSIMLGSLSVLKGYEMVIMCLEGFMLCVIMCLYKERQRAEEELISVEQRVRVR